MSESMADFEKEIDESLKTLNVVENEGEATEEETGFNAWDKVQQYLEDGTVLTLKVGGIVNKGVIVYVDGLRGFIPASHLEIGYVEDTNPYLGKTVEAKVITADPEKNRLVLSVKEVLYDKKRAEKEARINAIEAGAVLTGKVESLMPYGAFVDLGGIDGMVHISELSWKRIKHPSEVVSVGDTLEVYIKDLDREANRISLGFKKAEDNPWEIFKANYKVGDVVKATIVSITNFGAFAQIIDGVDGLIHISQIADRKVENVKDVLSVGDVVDVKIIDIDTESKRISISIRALLEDQADDDAAEDDAE